MDRERDPALAAVLREHGRRYPRMEPADGVKLVYQNEFGGGHLGLDPKKSLERLREEYNSVPHAGPGPLTEDIGGGMARVMLSGMDGRCGSLEELNGDFLRSALLRGGSKAAFLDKLETLRQMARQGELPFTGEALEGYLGPYLAAGCPPASHSETYRAAYRPAYRVVLRRASLCAMLEEIHSLQKESAPVLVAIDGRCAAGKTTLSGELHRRYGWSVVHMDHFFLRPEQRTRARYAAPGENIDHERFLEEVLRPLREHAPAVYRPFDCGTQRLLEPLEVPPAPVILIEGSYSCHRALWEYYDLRVFLDIGPEEQMGRIIARNGEEDARVFREKWIPLEERYIAEYDLGSRCDYRLTR